MPNIQITIDEKTIHAWKAEIEGIDREIKNKIDRKSKLQARLGSLQYFVDDLDQMPLPGFQEVQTKDSVRIGLQNGHKIEQPAVLTEMGPPEAIRFLLKREGRPIPQPDIRGMLKKEGYPMAKLGKSGNYFYTVLKRMERNKTIMREGNFIRLN